MNQLRPGTVPRPKTPRCKTREPYTFIHINKCAGTSIEIALGIPKRHETALDARARIGAEAWEANLTFAVVRHPLDRAAAVYFHRRRVGTGGLDQKLVSLDDWVRAVYRDRDPVYNEGTPYLAPAAHWVCEDGCLIVDEILRFEELPRDWARLAHRLGVCPVLPYLNVNPHKVWYAALSAGAQRIVAEAWASDFGLFGYEL